MSNSPILRTDPLGDTAIIRWHTGFLGLGGKHEVRFVGGNWINSKDRKAVSVSDVKNKNAAASMTNYNGLNNNSAFKKITGKINESSVNVVLNNNNTRNPQTDPDAKYRHHESNEIVVNLANSAMIDGPLNDSYKSVTLNGEQLMGHELSHVFDMLEGKPLEYFETTTKGTPWGTYVTVSNTEINAMYYENILRSQAGLPLRHSYLYTNNSGFGGYILENNDALINRDRKTGKPIQISDLNGNSFQPQ